MAYTNFTNCTKEQYWNIIYGEDSSNRIRIWFNNVELQDADEYCVSLKQKDSILPTDGKKTFTLSNFISKELELVLRDLPQGTTIEDQVRISLGTLVDVNNNTYEDVPLGVFNIQDSPTTDQNKVTIKLRDNRVKFDFNYNAQPLIESSGGEASLGDILDDICDQAGITNNVGSFAGDDVYVGIYDNTITATTYVGYIAEQCGMIPKIDRNGALVFIDIIGNPPNDHIMIPLSIVEKYEISEPYTIERVVYESGIIKYETDPDEDLDTLYLNSANPYVLSQTQVNTVYNALNTLEIDSVKTGKILGNPAIDSYDIIEVYDDEDENEPVIFKTFANNDLTYNGVNIQTFDTNISKEGRTENVTINNQATIKKYVNAKIDAVEGTIILESGRIDELSTEFTTFTEDQNSFKLEVNQKIDNSVQDLQDQIDDIDTSETQKLKNTMVTIDIDGIKVSTNLSKIETMMTNEKFSIVDSSGTELAFFGYDSTLQQSVSRMDNLTVTNFFIAGNHRQQKYGDYDERTGWFYIGGN